ncbi:hypothetical protein OKW23_001200 [Bacilli bacterium PM5-9]|nr:hypothetical protein [Bacilli bacterium PM5-9]
MYIVELVEKACNSISNTLYTKMVGIVAQEFLGICENK